MLSQGDLQKIEEIVFDVVGASEFRLKEEFKNEFATKKEFKKEINRLWRELRFIREALNATIGHFDIEI
ncbi:hypothetical protein HY419_01970, partial [candidate division WWE3 bacterium]|nr:hypothetical protein [candidate division WWE3 bacterium]